MANGNITCRICGVGGFHWVTKPGTPPTLYDRFDAPHQLYVDGKLTGCANKPNDEWVPTQGLALPAEPQHITTQVVQSSTVKLANIESKVEQAITMATAMTGVAAKIGIDVNQLKDEFAKLDGKWTAIAESKRQVEIRVGDASYTVTERQHKMTETVLRLLMTNESVYERGPAGSGKTTSAQVLANILHIPLYVFTCGPMTSKSDIFGYIAMGTGEYVTSHVRQAVEFGGLLVIDEVDAGLPGLNLMFNMIVEPNNRIVAFPDRQVEKHKDFHVIVTANTFGLGADATYIGRNQQDGAFLDRFSVVNWDYDWEFVTELSGDAQWTNYVRELFESASDQKLRVVIGPRAAIQGAKQLRSEFTHDEVSEMRIWARISVDDRRKLESKVKPYWNQQQVKQGDNLNTLTDARAANELVKILKSKYETVGVQATFDYYKQIMGVSDTQAAREVETLALEGSWSRKGRW